MIIKRVAENVNRPKMKTFQEKLNRTLVCTSICSVIYRLENQ